MAKLLEPIKNFTSKITSSFGKRTAPIANASTNHLGIDIGAAKGTPVYAANSGTATTGYNSESGNYVKILGSDGITTFYGHLQLLLVNNGDYVNAGEQIALVGSTGISTGAHLHFGVYENGKAQDPLNYYGDQTTSQASEILPLLIGAAVLLAIIK